MVFFQALIRVVTRPVLIPAAAVAVGASYGTFKITRGVLQLVSPGLHPPDSYTKAMYATGIGVGACMVGVREMLLPRAPPTPPGPSSSSIVDKTLHRLESGLVNIHPRYRIVSLFAASFVAATVVEGLHYGSGGAVVASHTDHSKDDGKN